MNLSILVYLKHRPNKKGEHAIYMRLTLNGKRAEISLNRSVSKQKWHNKSQLLKGRTEEARKLNKYIIDSKSKIHSLVDQMHANGEHISLDTVVNKFKGKETGYRMLVEFVKAEYQKKEKTVKSSTYMKYKITLKHLKSFLKDEYDVEDISLKNVTPEFVRGFDYYLETNIGLGNNATIRNVKRVKSVLNIAVANGWVSKDPFVNYKRKRKVKNVICLTQQEIDKIVNQDIEDAVLDKVRDIFVFSIYTGLAYVDVKNLTIDNLVIGMDGYKWLKVRRQKSDVVCDIPLFPVSEAILDKYKDHIMVIGTGRLLPVISNQKMNAYLKNVALACGIKKKLHFHLARHSYGSTIAAGNNMPVESIMKIMGHTTISQAKHYVKISTSMILGDVDALRKKLSNEFDEENNRVDQKSVS